MITNRSTGSRLAQMDVDMDKTAQNKSLYNCNGRLMDFATFKQLFNKTEKLYHYTSFESAIKILESNKLRYSELKGLNDINESHRPGLVKYTGAFPDDKAFRDLQNAIQRFRQISFVVDDNFPGFDIIPLWGHYADKGNGVCLVLDKAKLEHRLMPQKQANRVDFQKICYMEKFNSFVASSGGSMTECKLELLADRKNAFFRKTKDWDYEQEYRVVKKMRGTKPAFLNVKNAFWAIILCNAPDIGLDAHISGSVQYSIIRKIAGKIPVCCYESFFENRILSCDGGQVWSSEDQ